LLKQESPVRDWSPAKANSSLTTMRGPGEREKHDRILGGFVWPNRRRANSAQLLHWRSE
jgi:hypothetical protein